MTLTFVSLLIIAYYLANQKWREDFKQGNRTFKEAWHTFKEARAIRAKRLALQQRRKEDA